MKNQSQFEIIISQVNWIGGDNKENRLGLTSSYYNNLYNDFRLNQGNLQKEKTKIIIKDSSFRIPEDTKSPMILFATGTGVAPYIGFLQELEIRKSQGKDVNKAVLLFGSKNKNYDFIYEKEISDWDKENVIEKLYLAFSRDQENKFYIQNVFADNFEEMKDYLNNEKCFVYVCGGVSMGQSLHKELERNLGKDFMQNLEKEQRYIKEFWGK